MSEQRHVFIIGSKGIPAAYGGYETFVHKLTEYRKENVLQYHVACASEENKREFMFHEAHCFVIKWKKIGAAKAVVYDCEAFKFCVDYIKKHDIQKPIVYVLACRLGPFFHYFVKCLHQLGGEVYINPDGHEWKRSKWSAPVRHYWKFSEKLMLKYSDLIICDSKNIQKYVLETYKKYNPRTTYIAYGSETNKSMLKDDDPVLLEWYRKYRIAKKEYYLVVGRFVPENNYEIMIREFMASGTSKSFVLITNVSDKFLNELKKKTGFDKDSRIKFVGTVYDPQLLKKIRENAYGYFHGHEVGGTNPSLLEALGSTELNLILDVEFNREVAEEGALYWKKKSGSLSALIDYSEKMTDQERTKLGQVAKKRIADYYTWEYITEKYEKLFLMGKA
ncbi:MAG: DUF1972 domain-containing protein [Eubacterium sp.]|nr:DUF1972 domain-containing protein [Eubacterium sp.]